MGLLVAVILLVGSVTTLLVASGVPPPPPDRPPVDLVAEPDTSPGVPGRVRGEADFTRRRFFYQVDLDALGRPDRTTLVEYFPVRLAEDEAVVVGRVLAELDDPSDRTAHEAERFQRALEVVADQEFTGLVETTPPAIREDLAAGQARRIRSVNLLVDDGRTALRARSARRTSLLAVAGIVAGIAIALAIGRPLRRAMSARG